MYLNFDDSRHWVDVYRARLRGELPPVQMRLCTKFRRGPGAIPADVPSYPRWSPKLLGKLVLARVVMQLRALAQRRVSWSRDGLPPRR
jgi:hypothetical protein